MEINIDWEKIKESNLYNEKLYEKIISIQNSQEKSNAEAELFKTAKRFKISTVVQKKYYDFEKKYKLQLNSTSSIDFR